MEGVTRKMNKNFAKNNIFLFLLIMMLIVMGGCTQGGQGEEQSAAQPGTIASEYLTELSDMGGRVTGTDAETAAGDWVQATLEDMGYTVTAEPFDYDVEGAKGSSRNFIAVKEGTSDKTVILGAHYDSVDVGNGVDDNGSGVAVVLEAAKVLKDVETPQTIQFIFFGAEEAGLCGSDYHVNKMTQEEKGNVLVMINYDSLVAGEKAYVYGDGDAEGKFRDRALAIAAEKNLELITQPGENPEYPAGTTGDWSDHAAFKNVDIPYMYFESTNWALGEKDGYTQVAVTLGESGEIWHTQYDTVDYISTNFPDRIENRLATFSTVTEEILQEDMSKL
jgi:alkaline phosphatase isozyme conversion protein